VITNNSLFYKRIFISLSLLFSSTAIQAEWFEEKTAGSLREAISEGQTQLDFRLRYEDIQQGNQGAQALTLRSRIGFETLPFELFKAYVEFDDVRAIPNDDNYYSGGNNEFDDVFLEDPEGTELNQAWLAYDIANTLIKVGRQTLSLNNERLLGGDSWRQNEQTFTAFSIQNETLNYTRLEFVQINRIQTNQDDQLSGSHQDINAKLFNLNYRGFWLSDLSLYALWISDHPDQAQWETSTYGMRFEGEMGGDFSVSYQLALAQQEDAGANTVNYSASYTLIDLLFAYRGVHVNVGYEKLGADNVGYFITPLASLHEFQGASDQFDNNSLGNISGGIQDSYLGLGYLTNIDFAKHKLPLSMSINYHDYRADSPVNGLSHYGEEWGAMFELELERTNIIVQYADYHADHYGQNDQHVWLAINVAF